MPRRRRGQEARRAQRRASRLAAAAESRTRPEPSYDEVWAEHQEWEKMRRATPPVSKPRPKPFDIRPVIAAVMADFARWEREREERQQ